MTDIYSVNFIELPKPILKVVISGRSEEDVLSDEAKALASELAEGNLFKPQGERTYNVVKRGRFDFFLECTFLERADVNPNA
jgi:hypothetical protein